MPAAGWTAGLRSDLSLLYHATPLHYLPHVLQSSALYAKSVLASRGISPRATAVRRDRMLGLSDWIHLSLRPDSPLLRDKLRKGYPHALLVFDRQAVLAMPQVALLPYNTKAWRTRASSRPVTDPVEKAALLRRHLETGRCPSLEVLVHYGLDLAALVQVRFVTEEEQGWVEELRQALALPTPAPWVADADLFALCDGYRPVTGAAIAAYFAACERANSLLPPPPIPFD